MGVKVKPREVDEALKPVSTGVEGDTFFHICSAIDSPRSLTAWLLYKHKEFAQLVDLNASPDHYFENDSARFMDDHLVSSYFSKYRDFNIAVNREDAAFLKWKAAEESCRRTNERFRAFWSGENPFPPEVVNGILHCRSKIHKILGSEMPTVIKDEDRIVWSLAEYGRFGPGSDLSTHGDNTSAYHKYASPGTVTPWVLPLLEDVLDDDRRLDLVHQAQLVGSNRLSFVPKNAKIDRAICVEPRWNIFIQLGIGMLISKRLRSVGIDLTDQMPNRVSAARAHRDGLVTVDLSSASDTIAKNLVLDFLPDSWADAILKSRSPSTIYRGKVYQLEKVSSMGNGYTFPLESLIFYAICHYACERVGADCAEIRVFGDDLVVPRECYTVLESVLTGLGFSVNTEKTCTRGLFFESCGADYFNGVNVRPVFIKERVTCVKEAFGLANRIVDFARRSLGYDGFDRRFWKAYRTVVRSVPRSLRLYGPVNAGDGVIHASFDTCRPTPALHGWEGYTLYSFVAIPIRKHGNSFEGHLYSKLSQQVSDSKNGVTTRNRVRWKKRRVYVSSYTDFLVT